MNESDIILFKQSVLERVKKEIRDLKEGEFEIYEKVLNSYFDFKNKKYYENVLKNVKELFKLYNYVSDLSCPSKYKFYIYNTKGCAFGIQKGREFFESFDLRKCIQEQADVGYYQWSCYDRALEYMMKLFHEENPKESIKKIEYWLNRSTDESMDDIKTCPQYYLFGKYQFISVENYLDKYLYCEVMRSSFEIQEIKKIGEYFVRFYFKNKDRIKDMNKAYVSISKLLNIKWRFE